MYDQNYGGIEMVASDMYDTCYGIRKLVICTTYTILYMYDMYDMYD